MDTILSINSIGTSMSTIEGETRGIGGRKASEILYEDVDDHMEGMIISKGKIVWFKIDNDDFEKVKSRNWYVSTEGKYIASHITIKGARKILYLHNFVMNKLTFEGKGQNESVDHINRDGLDNRKCNLRIVSQTQQNINQKKKPRRAILPLEYNLKSEDLPKHVTYVPARGNHGDGFCIEFKLNGKKIYNPYIRSKYLSIEEKLENIKCLLQKGYELYPEYNPNNHS
jgi:hypothetical protein